MNPSAYLFRTFDIVFPRAHRARGPFGQLAVWRERCEQRRHLAGLDDRILKDIGLSRAEVAHETDKPFWQE